jgi:hypothetical protein
VTDAANITLFSDTAKHFATFLSVAKQKSSEGRMDLGTIF